MNRDDKKEKSPAAKPKTSKSGPSGRDARLAEALRANLRRRKAQAQSRKQGRTSDPGPSES